MSSLIDRFIVGICVAVVVALVVVPIAVEAPMFVRCTQAAQDILDRANPRDRQPPHWVVAAVEHDLTDSGLALGAARMSMWNSRCNGRRPRRSVLRLYETMVLSYWWRIRFSHDDIVALYVSQAWLGARSRGFSAASHKYFHRELSALTPDEQRCLIERLRSRYPRRFSCDADRVRAVQETER